MKRPESNGLGNPDYRIPSGRHEIACYKEAEISLYDRNNPFLDALPSMLEVGQVIGKLAYYPPYKESERNLPAHLRTHCLTAAKQFFQPLPAHTDLEGRISRMIRSGYLARNPADPHYSAWIRNQVEQIGSTTPKAFADGEQLSRFRSPCEGFALVGIPGTGKTTATEAILKELYPQVIIHQNYKGSPMPVSQVVWLMMGCPYDGSIRGLCLSFFKALDLALHHDPGKGYFQLYGKARRNVDELTLDMATLAGLHGLGVLVVDEVQHLSAAGIGTERMLNFFVTLENLLQLPILLVGTFKALPILNKEFRQIRRSSSQGDFIWEPMRLDGNWTTFMESLWDYQYTSKLTPLTPALSACFHELTYGIPDFVVKLFTLAQVRAITNGIEQVTEDVVRSVAFDSLRLASPVIKALRERDWNKLGEYEDIQPIRWSPDSHVSEGNVSKDSVPQSNSQASNSEESAPPEPKEPKKSSDSEAADQKIIPKIKKIVSQNNGLVAICAASAKEKIAPYATLKAAGFIRPPTEFFEGQENVR